MKKTSDVKLFMMPKPECGRHLSKLEETLNSNNFLIEEIYQIEDCGSVAREIYGPQLKDGSETFVLGFEVHVWLLKYLFGNRSLVLTVDKKSDNSTLSEKLKELYKLKHDFRDSLLGAEEGTFLVNIDLSKIPEFTGKGQKGKLGIFNGSKFVSFDGNYDGAWECIFFKYVHSPDPELQFLQREWSILKKRQIISPNNQIIKQEWNLMKYLNTLIPPSKFYKRK